ncbi:unnamed protein product [Dibothriocephalus latus]|uniref:Uncharacterized protein n=1 Tax=Dibothriocephalus latus TaxID=60516 RepID=A0A3P7N8V2_DIBLA|nr:unnamed protein product [Dibothriocephalus latus]
MISEGCDILLDASQVFVRQGTLAQVTVGKSNCPCPRIPQIGSISPEHKERLRQVLLFTNYLLITTRTGNGRLRLAKPDVDAEDSIAQRYRESYRAILAYNFSWQDGNC